MTKTMIIKNIEAIAWIKKYLIADEVDSNLCLFIRMGIIDIMLISRDNHAVNHELDEITIIVLIKIININDELEYFKNIKKRTFCS